MVPPLPETAIARVRRRLIVHGRVQGVWFRTTTQRLAAREGVAGWVRNELDGTVQAVFEGEAEAVERLVDFCRLGPPDAHVKRVEILDESPEGLTDFAVR